MLSETASAITIDDEAATFAAVDRFAAAFDRHDVAGIMAAMTDDCIFEDTPPPDGKRYHGQAAVKAYWEQFFTRTPSARFTGEARFAAGDRCVVQWRYHWGGAAANHVRGVDLFRVRDGKVSEKIAYVKG